MNVTLLKQFPQSMAEAVKPAIGAVTLEGYTRFLSAMVHYTRHSGRRLQTAAERSPEGAVRDFFAQLAREEAGHYRLAEADLRALGAVVEGNELARVEAFDRAWMEAASPGFWLGSLYALEGVGAYLGQTVGVHLMRLGLTAQQSTFVRVHLVVDEDHAARSEAACAVWPEEAAVVEGARAAADFWVGLHLDALRA